MWHQHLMRRIIATDPILSRMPTLQVVKSFNETLAPAIMRQFADVSALGGDPDSEHKEIVPIPDGLEKHSAAARLRFSHAPDQSLAAHVINGVFAGYRVAGQFPDIFKWGDLRWRLWTLGFTLHDYGKAVEREVHASQIEKARPICLGLGKQLNFSAFLPDWEAYLDDILFLAQNVQTRKESLLATRSFDLKVHPSVMEQPRLLGSFVDVLLHVREPREVAMRGADGSPRHENLRDKLQAFFPFGQAPRLAYHQIAEVRGLLTNILHNATQETLAQLGYSPYLYFANGVVYLTSRDQQVRVDINTVADAAWQQIVSRLTHLSTFGTGHSQHGILVAPPMYGLLDAKGILELGKQYALNKITTSDTGEQLKKMGVDETALPIDVRSAQLAEFLIHLTRNVVEQLFPKRTRVTAALLSALGLSDVVSEAEAEYQNGGVRRGLFYVASRYFENNSAVTPPELPMLFDTIAAKLFAVLSDQGLHAEEHLKLHDAFMSYVKRVLVIDDVLFSGGSEPRVTLEAELAGYVNGKAANRPLCSLCSSPYDNEEQAVTVVIFKPQQYSTKNKLGGSHVVRGICPICSLEMLLRQAMQGAHSGKFQDQKAINLSLYPSYFFTPEMARLVKDCVQYMSDVNLTHGQDSLLNFLRTSSKDGSLAVDALLEYEYFLNEDIVRRRTIWSATPEYRSDEFHGFTMLALIPEDREPTDTDAWILPAFYALALPLLLNVKVVASTSFIPLYARATDFTSTSVLDGVHPVLRLALGVGRPDVAHMREEISSLSTPTDQCRVGRLRPTLRRLLAFYDLHTDVFTEGYDKHWAQFGAVVRDVDTDRYNVFAYYDRKKRGGGTNSKGKQRLGGAPKGNGAEPARSGISPRDQSRYLDIYLSLGGEDSMGIIGKLVTSYAQFYLAQGDKLSSAYSVLKPLATAIDVTVNSAPNIDKDDLVEIISGSINDLMERVRSRQADGWDPILTNRNLGDGATRLDLSRRHIYEFAEIFVNELFLHECDGDRAVLRERANQFRSAARFYYLTHFTPHGAARPDDSISSSTASE